MEVRCPGWRHSLAVDNFLVIGAFLVADDYLVIDTFLVVNNRMLAFGRNGHYERKPRALTGYLQQAWWPRRTQPDQPRELRVGAEGRIATEQFRGQGGEQ